MSHKYHAFLSHVEKDSALALELANRLEQLGYSIWYYERDTIPGLSYLTQVVDAIGHSATFLLLISHESLRSREVDIEVFQGHAKRRAFLPVLVDASQADVQRQSNWAAILGATASIGIHSADFEAVVSRIARGLQELTGVCPKPISAPPRRDATPLMQRFHRAWVSDANQIDLHDLDKVVFRNDLIDNFLQSRSKYFLSASKGLGKTLLLTYKRYLLSRHADAEDRGRHGPTYFVPDGRPYLDFMNDLQSISKDTTSFLSELRESKRLWSFALRLSALSFHGSLMTDADDHELALLPTRLAQWLRGGRIEPTFVFKELLSHSISEIHRIMDEMENYIELKFRSIHSGTYIFVDKVDQAIRHLPRLAWIHIQAGLIEAAWDLMNANAHVKIYAAIRQEAFSNYESDIRANLLGATTILRYSQTDLSGLLDQLTECYEGGKTFKEFARVHTVCHRHSDLCEDAFQFLHRHTLGRPRDLVIVASRLSAVQGEISASRYRSLVSEASDSLVVGNVFNEVRAFLDSLRDRESRQRFFGLIPRNILTLIDLQEICAAYNGIDAESLQQLGCDSEAIYHPFWELYNTGLLGVVLQKPDGLGWYQRFRQPDDMTHADPTDLPKVQYYLIHPALTPLISKYRVTPPFHVSPFVIVGHDYPWEEYYGTLLHAERLLTQVKSNQTHDRVSEAISTVMRNNARAGCVGNTSETSGTTDWKSLEDQLQAESHEELWLWLVELGAPVS